MEGVSHYLIRVVCAALVCSVANRLGQGSGCQGALRILSGVFLTIVLIQPLGKLWDFEPAFSPQDWDLTAQAIAAEGTASAQKMRGTIITQQLESYIITKAKEAGASVHAEVTVGEDFLPTAVVISGPVSPGAKQKLTRILTGELGIPEACQQWTG